MNCPYYPCTIAPEVKKHKHFENLIFEELLRAKMRTPTHIFSSKAAYKGVRIPTLNDSITKPCAQPMSKIISAYHRSYPPPLAALTATHANKCPLSWLSYLSQPLLHYFRMHTRHQPDRRRTMAQIMKALFCNRD